MKTVGLAMNHQGRNYKLNVPATIVGVWAVHHCLRDVKEDGTHGFWDEWQITHAPSGYQFRTWIKRKREAMDLARRMDAALPAITDPRDIGKYVADITRIVNEWKDTLNVKRSAYDEAVAACNAKAGLY
jgi:hypothetical protein